MTDDSPIAHLVEFPDIYDGYSVIAMKDGTFINRWAEADGAAIPGYERRWAKTQEYIDAYDESEGL